MNLVREMIVIKIVCHQGQNQSTKLLGLEIMEKLKTVLVMALLMILGLAQTIMCGVKIQMVLIRIMAQLVIIQDQESPQVGGEKIVVNDGGNTI